MKGLREGKLLRCRLSRVEGSEATNTVSLPAVLHGDGYCLHIVWCPLAHVVCLLLERYIKNPVLDCSCYFPRNA